MSNDRLEELLSAELDGALEPAEQAELDRLRAAGDAAETERQYRELDELLGKLPAAEPPATLRRRILATASVPRPAAPPKQASNGWQWLKPAPLLHYGLAAAAGAFVVFAAFNAGGPANSTVSVDDLVGSMAPAAPQLPEDVIDYYRFEREAFDSRITLERKDDRLVLDIAMLASDPLDIVVDLGEAGVAFDALAQVEGELESIMLAGQELRVRGLGRRRLLVLLRREYDAATARGAEISLEFSSEGEVLEQGSLSPTS